MTTPHVRFALGLTLVAAAALGGWAGCAKVSDKPKGGTGGSGGSAVMQMPAIPGLVELKVMPTPQTIGVMDDGSGFTGNATFMAQGRKDSGEMFDATSMVNWTIDVNTAVVTAGRVTVHAPGHYTITARSGGVSGTGELIAQFTGYRLGTGFMPGDMPKLDASPGGTSATLAYPLDGAIFPSNFGPITVHIPRSGTQQDIARLAFVEPTSGLDFKYYARCDAVGANLASGCYVTLPIAFTSLLVAPSSANDISLTARIASSAGGAVTESNTIKVAWANVRLSGGLYYWSTIDRNTVPGYDLPPMASKGTGVLRYDFDTENPDGAKPQVIYTDQGMQLSPGVFGNPGPNGVDITYPQNNPASPPTPQGTDPQTNEHWGEGTCVGCHALSFDGKLLAFAIGGSSPASFAIMDLEARHLLELDPAAGPADQANINYLRRFQKANFAVFTTFGPSETNRLMVNSYRGKFTLHQADATLAVLKDDVFATNTAERKADPFWSPDGTLFAFSSYDLAMETQTSKYNGDTKTGAQLWLATATATGGPNDDAQILVARESGRSIYYPAISHDSKLLAFNKSDCTGPATSGYGAGACDGYDDVSATLWLTSPAAGAGRRTPASLDRANGDVNSGNSWPRWSPDSGSFRGQTLYWLAFSSRRRYGLQINTAGATVASPQLWFAAVVVGGEFSSGDVSYRPIWLPGQNLNPTVPTGNHVPQWVKFAIAID